MKEEILLVGGGGHCAACIDVIESQGRYRIGGIVDLREKLHQMIMGYEVTGCDEDLPELVKEYKNFLVTIGQLKSADKRISRFEYLKGLGAGFVVVVSPYALVSRSAAIGDGTIVMHRAVVNAGAQIGENCIINTGAVIEHNAEVDNHCHISTGSIVNGDCRIGKASFIGSGSVLVNGVGIAENTVIGAGSVVVKSIEASGVYAGKPARRTGLDVQDIYNSRGGRQP
jgi:sugar O-acyltransferase (sialic acid O-acetyltransferase NeuD family)